MFSLDTSTSTPQSSFAQSGTSASTLSVNMSTPGQSWIIDSGTFDHMIGTSSFFSSYSICFGNNKGPSCSWFSSSIAGKGNIPVTLTLPLSSVLHVPNFTLNLLFISHLTRSLNCSVTFFPSYCVFQDLDSKMTIGKGHEDNGLYILDIPSHSALLVQQFLIPSIKDNNISF